MKSKIVILKIISCG